MHQIELEKVKLAFAEKLSGEMLGVMVDIREDDDDFIHDRFTLIVSGYLWGESGKMQTISYPSTWWDAFKERWFPQWLLTRYPTNHQHHEITLKTLYPNFRISMPSEAHVLKFMVRDYSDLSTF